MYRQEDNFIDKSPSGDLLFHNQTVYQRENYAGFWLRVAAYFIDAIVCWVVLFAVSMIFGISMAFNTEFESLGGGAIGILVVIYLSIFLYFPVMESSSWQATIGKRAVGIKVVDLDGRRIAFSRALGRFFAKFLSALILYIGFIMAGFTDRKQALHDIITGTLVIKDSEKVL